MIHIIPKVSVQSVCRFLCQSYYRNSIGVVVAFSLLSRASWDMVDSWVQEARSDLTSWCPLTSQYVQAVCRV